MATLTPTDFAGQDGVPAQDTTRVMAEQNLGRGHRMHGSGMQFPPGVALLEGDDLVVHTLRLGRHCFVLVRRRTRRVLEAEAGSFERWGLRVGDALVVDP